MREYVTIVSGMPRSGTSLAMQMLRAGGMPLLIDDHRAADVHEDISNMSQSSAWQRTLRG
jgi:hypothetical protein